MPKKAQTHSAAGKKAYSPEQGRIRRRRRGPRYYDTARWKRLRKMVLARDPLCVMCLAEGRTEPSTCVDHIVDLKDGGTNRKDNLQGLCDSCHNRKTATKRGGFGR